MTKVGLFFGSFNPIHVGHLIIAQAALNETDLDQVWIVVSPQNPLKDKKGMLDENNRYWLVQQAIEGNHKLFASNIEFSLPRPSYTVDTLLHLREKFPAFDFSIIMGEDNLEHLHKWKNYEVILEYYRIFAYPRGGSDGSLFLRYPKVRKFDLPLLDISATRIRSMIREGKSVRYMLTEPVWKQIIDSRYYAED
jgi:nicotinate-nucleotide adenylyltransferase